MFLFSPVHKTIVPISMSQLYKIRSYIIPSFPAWHLTDDTTSVYCDGCTFVIPTDGHGDPVNGNLYPVRNSITVTCHKHSVIA